MRTLRLRLEKLACKMLMHFSQRDQEANFLEAGTVQIFKCWCSSGCWGNPSSGLVDVHGLSR